ncbi:MAG: hypothetical protein LCH90_08550 [Proteobacteria bacterium]|nr:hypothetical protein [Pseudomonadota bacterium]
MKTTKALSTWEPGACVATVAPEQALIVKALRTHSSQYPLPLPDLLKHLGDTDAVRTALAVLVSAREVMQATVIKGGTATEVLYPCGRVPETRPGRKAGRAPAVVITPSTHAKSVHKGAQA